MYSRYDVGGKKKGRPRMQYIDNIMKWTRASLEENIRVAEDRTAWCKRSGAARGAELGTDNDV